MATPLRGTARVPPSSLPRRASRRGERDDLRSHGFHGSLAGYRLRRNTNLAFRVWAHLGCGPFANAWRVAGLPGDAPPSPLYRRHRHPPPGVRRRTPDRHRPRAHDGRGFLFCCTRREEYGKARVWRHKGVRPNWFDKLYGTDRTPTTASRYAAVRDLQRVAQVPACV